MTPIRAVALLLALTACKSPPPNPPPSAPSPPAPAPTPAPTSAAPSALDQLIKVLALGNNFTGRNGFAGDMCGGYSTPQHVTVPGFEFATGLQPHVHKDFACMEVPALAFGFGDKDTYFQWFRRVHVPKGTTADDTLKSAATCKGVGAPCDISGVRECRVHVPLSGQTLDCPSPKGTGDKGCILCASTATAEH
jgi:hypothetical protein